MYGFYEERMKLICIWIAERKCPTIDCPHVKVHTEIDECRGEMRMCEIHNTACCCVALNQVCTEN